MFCKYFILHVTRVSRPAFIVDVYVCLQVACCQVSVGGWTVTELVARQQHHHRDDEWWSTGQPVGPVWEVSEYSTDSDWSRASIVVDAGRGFGSGATASAQVGRRADLSSWGWVHRCAEATVNSLPGWHWTSSTSSLYCFIASSSRFSSRRCRTDGTWCKEEGNGWCSY